MTLSEKSTNILQVMENEEIKETTAGAPAPAPTTDACDRLNAARQYASEQYEKIRRAAAEQMVHVREYADQARAQLNEGWDKARVQMNEGWDKTRAAAREYHKTGEEYVKENPTASVLGALGIGVLIGLVLGGRR